ncbi:MAG: hypothetical protein DWQ37_11450 [Planctomycetota bacterium]|nr:MAG: hypothetical protein DWQ37_11450 [Planctomycetota bacterium]
MSASPVSSSASRATPRAAGLPYAIDLRTLWTVVVLCATLATSGCCGIIVPCLPPLVKHPPKLLHGPPKEMLAPSYVEFGENPAHVACSDPEFLYENLVDIVDDYFEIAREERVRYVADVVTEGRIDTYPLTGATQFEPWRRDTVTTYERLESTLQSMRRTAQIRIIPVEFGFLVDVQVQKELEDVLAPEGSTLSLNNLRNDDALNRRGQQLNVSPDSLGWIPQGRDFALEQEILGRLQKRMAQVAHVH